jgi:ATP-dependent RNA helicase DeaD
MDHIDRGSLNTSNIKYLIIDEADEMLNMGFIDQVREILRGLNKNRQSILLSARDSKLM